MTTVTIQKTSKSLKLQKVLAAMTFIASGLVYMNGSHQLAMVLFLGSIVWGTVVSIAIWWDHA
jgi:hypothetical protein